MAFSNTSQSWSPAGAASVCKHTKKMARRSLYYPDIDRFCMLALVFGKVMDTMLQKNIPIMRQQQKELLVHLPVNTACFGIRTWIHLIQL